MKTCPKCNSQYDDALSFCKYDGTALFKVIPNDDKKPVDPHDYQTTQSGMVCPKCGRQYDSKYRFCYDDGTPLVPISTDQVSITDMPHRAQSKPVLSINSKWSPPIILPVVFVVILLIGAVFALTRVKTVTSDGFREIEDSDVDESGESEESSEQSTNETRVYNKVDDKDNDSLEPWASDLIVASEKQAGEYDEISLYDFDNDQIPELILHGIDDPTSLRILHWKDTQIEDMIDISDGVTVFLPDSHKLLWSSTENDTVYDRVFELNADCTLTSLDDGHYKQDTKKPFDRNGKPLFNYTFNNEAVDEFGYANYINVLCMEDRAISLNSLPTISRNELEDYLDDGWKDLYGNVPDNNAGLSVTISFEPAAQFFIAPYTGKYRFILYGANGGTDNFRSYDDEGGAATLTGTMRLKAGQRVIVLTGGRGDSAVAEEGLVKGGFNGGGNAHWSGGGGGCTEIWYDGTRIAAAAGGGGGNFEEVGKLGRTSKEAAKNVTDSKFGAGDGSSDTGGGGGGWYGGVTGGTDSAGFGGVNGWMADCFDMESESSGTAYKESGSFDGSVLIKYFGK